MVLKIEKLAEEWIKVNLSIYFESNSLISDFHHGGRKGLSTLTAKATLDNIINKNVEDNLITGALSCDLSSCFEIVDHRILEKKLEFYGIKGVELELFKSYLSNWQQFVEVDTFRSNLIHNLPVSCIQGSKLYTFLWTIDSLETPLVQKLMKNPKLYKAVTGLDPPNMKMPKHESNTFVDDSFSTIGFEPSAKIKTYLEKYYNLMESFYNSNKLKINPQKTKLMFISKAKFRPLTKTYHLEQIAMRLNKY